MPPERPTPGDSLEGFLTSSLTGPGSRRRGHVRREVRWEASEGDSGIDEALCSLADAGPAAAPTSATEDGSVAPPAVAPDAVSDEALVPLAARVASPELPDTEPVHPGDVVGSSGARRSVTLRESAATESGVREVKPRTRRAGTLAWGVSLLLHSTGLGGGALLVARMSKPVEPPVEATVVAAAPAPDDGMIELELPTMRETTTLYRPGPVGSNGATTAPVPVGGQDVPRPDQDHAGRGGTPTSAQQALNLADHDDSILLSKDLFSRLDRSQVQRLKTADDRASQDDRRATWRPMELTFLASGKGTLQERRPVAESDPSHGARPSQAAVAQGGALGATPMPAGEGESPRTPGQATAGSETAQVGRGIARAAEGSDHRESADVAFARPSITDGRPAVPAVAVERPRDNVDSDQEVASAVQSLLHASTAGGRVGEGVGGEGGPGKPGAGGDAGPGSAARAAGQGPGVGASTAGGDPTVGAYVRMVYGRVNAAWGGAFPRDHAVEGRQGVAVIGFRILADGRVVGVTLRRTSGLPEFDEIVRRAVLKAGQFPPLPASLGASRAFEIGFDAKNPAVR